METNAAKRKVSLVKRIYRWSRRLFALKLLVLLVLVVVGARYEKSSAYSDSQKFTPPGQMINLNGHDMHVYAEGVGENTVVFASGWGIPCPFAEYYPLYDEISKTSRIVVYDRPGYGWSEVTNSPMDIDTMTEEIHQLLEKSGEKPPFILVGHSIASLEVLRFAQLYGDEVQGIVLLDGGSPEFYAKNFKDESAKSGFTLTSLLNKVGLFRILFEKSPVFVEAVYAPRNNFSLVPDPLKELDQAMYLKNMVNRNKSDEIVNININAAKVAASGTTGDIPLVILTSESEAEDPEWKASQEALKNWSTISRQRILAGTNHNMQQFVPDIINREILNLIQSLAE